MSHRSCEQAPSADHSLLSEVERTAARYLFTISQLSTDANDRITTGEIQKPLDVSPASVTEMVARLDEHGYVDYKNIGA
jgi:DtxR family Mn-dependent transcriptional regulator